MLKLGGKVIAIHNVEDKERGVVLRLTSNPELPIEERRHSAFLINSEISVPDGFCAYIAIGGHEQISESIPKNFPLMVLSEEYDYLRSGDVVRISPQAGRVRALYRKAAYHNSLLVTERCDNFCLMCSQPPKAHDDSWIADSLLEVIPLIDLEAKEICFTGGEPTLLGDKLLTLINMCAEHLPNTAVHVLSNGRRFSDPSFARSWANLNHPDLMVGIPIYSDISNIHDYVVQADGAFDETIRGVLNLKRYNARVEIRVVLHQQTYRDLPRLAEFITRNLRFVDHVALMGLEITGFTRANLDKLWIDPVDYQNELLEAVNILDAGRMRVSIYNHQLCLLDRRMWPFAVKSISDWKNEYHEECTECSVRDECGGFFSSAQYKCSEHIAAIRG